VPVARKLLVDVPSTEAVSPAKACTGRVSYRAGKRYQVVIDINQQVNRGR